MRESVNRAFQTFSNLKVLIIGDVMVDAYFWGRVDRISPEAPVPVVSVTRKDNRLGGAANVARNVQAMGATPIMCSVIGDDEKGNLFLQLMAEESMVTTGILQAADRATTVKTRILGSNQQILRVDEEQIDDLSAELTQQFLTTIEKTLDTENIDAIVFEDYDKGLMTPELIRGVVRLAQQKNIPTAVDPKKKNFLQYAGVTLFKPNLKELREGLKLEIETPDQTSLDVAVAQLQEVMPVEMALITLSELGVYINDGREAKIFPAHIRSIADVSGAGDTVISVAVLCLAAGISSELVARLSNLAGGLVCESVGVVPIDRELLLKEALLLG